MMRKVPFTSPFATERPKLLVVDDETNQLSAWEEALKDLDIELFKAGSGREAVGLVKSHEFFLIFLDIKMPGMDGFKTAELIRHFGKSQHSPLVFITGYALKETHLFKGYNFGAVDYLIKPVPSKILKSKARVFLDLFQQKKLIMTQNEQLENALKEKNFLLKEIHHRVKNNMQVIASLLDLQLSGMNKQPVESIIRESMGRVYVMATIHESLYQSENLSEIDFKPFVSQLSGLLSQTYLESPGLVTFNIEGPELRFGISEANPLGLVLNELISNSLKHAFPGEQKGTITIRTHTQNENTVKLIISDNGVGLPDGFDWTESDTLGLRLVKNLVEQQLNGSVEYEDLNGAIFTIKLNLDSELKS